MAKYRVELRFNKVVVGNNMFAIARNLRFKKRRNGASQIEFGIGAEAFHEWCRRRGEYAQNVLHEWLSDVVVYRNEKPIVSGFVAKIPGNFNTNDSTIQVQVDGYIKQLEKRFITKTYSGMYTTDIVKDALQLSQSEERGDLGFTVNPSSYRGKEATRQDTYERTPLYDILVNRSSYVSDPYDFDVDENRQITFYKNKGNKRTDTVITYPGDYKTIPARSARFSHTGTNLANRIIALGYGEGEEVLQYVANDYASQIKYGVIEDVVAYNGVKLMSTLQDYAEAELRARKEILILPKLNVNGQHFDLGEYDVGDCIIAKHGKYSLYALEEMYRIEEIAVSVDDTGDEDIALTIDKFTVW